MDYYNALIAEKENSTVRQQPAAAGKLQTISGTGEAVVSGIRLLNAAGDAIEAVSVGEPVTLEISVAVRQDVENLVLGYMIKDRLGQPVFGTNTHHLGKPESRLAAGESLKCRFSFRADLGEGSYSIATAIASSETHLTHNYEWRDLALVFQVLNMGVPGFVGTAFLPTSVTTERTALHDAETA